MPIIWLHSDKEIPHSVLRTPFGMTVINNSKGTAAAPTEPAIFNSFSNGAAAVPPLP